MQHGMNQVTIQNHSHMMDHHDVANAHIFKASKIAGDNCGGTSLGIHYIGVKFFVEIAVVALLRR